MGIAKADAMDAKLSVDPYTQRALEEVIREQGSAGRVEMASEKLVMRPSNGVVEASDYLSGKHDWVQLKDEVTYPMKRCIYTPPAGGEGSSNKQARKGC